MSEGSEASGQAKSAVWDSRSRHVGTFASDGFGHLAESDGVVHSDGSGEVGKVDEGERAGEKRR